MSWRLGRRVGRRRGCIGFSSFWTCTWGCGGVWFDYELWWPRDMSWCVLLLLFSVFRGYTAEPDHIAWSKVVFVEQLWKRVCDSWRKQRQETLDLVHYCNIALMAGVDHTIFWWRLLSPCPPSLSSTTCRAQPWETCGWCVLSLERQSHQNVVSILFVQTTPEQSQQNKSMGGRSSTFGNWELEVALNAIFFTTERRFYTNVPAGVRQPQACDISLLGFGHPETGLLSWKLLNLIESRNSDIFRS